MNDEIDSVFQWNYPLNTQKNLHIGIEIEYIDHKTGKTWIDETQEISAMLVGLIRSLKTEN